MTSSDVTTRVPTRRLFTSVGLCVLLSLPAVVVRFSGLHVEPVVAMLVFGAAVFAASFVLAWAAEAAQVDISGGLAIAILALIAGAARVRGRPVLRVHGGQ